MWLFWSPSLISLILHWTISISWLISFLKECLLLVSELHFSDLGILFKMACATSNFVRYRMTSFSISRVTSTMAPLFADGTVISTECWLPSLHSSSLLSVINLQFSLLHTADKEIWRIARLVSVSWGVSGVSLGSREADLAILLVLNTNHMANIKASKGKICTKFHKKIDEDDWVSVQLLMEKKISSAASTDWFIHKIQKYHPLM